MVGIRPNSGLELLPKIVTPASRKRWARVPVWSATLSLQDAGAEGGARALQQIEILQQERHAGEGAVGKSLVDLPLGIVVVLDHDRVDLRIDLGGAGDRLVEQFARR